MSDSAIRSLSEPSKGKLVQFLPAPIGRGLVAWGLVALGVGAREWTSAPARAIPGSAGGAGRTKGCAMTDRFVGADHLHDPAGRPAFGR